MRRVFIQKEKGEFVSEPCYVAYFGFKNLGYEIEFYEEVPPKDLLRSDIVVGWIGSVKTALKNLNITPPGEIDYPDELIPYYRRKIWESTFNSINEEDYPIFIKPKRGKYFNGKLITKFSDLIRCRVDVHGDIDIWCSEPVTFISEWRVFVRYGKVLDAKKYKGSPFTKLNEGVVEKAILDYKSQPAAYCMDFGLTDKGEVLVIEVNDGYAMGTYGLFADSYAKLISARWSQLVGIPDELACI